MHLDFPIGKVPGRGLHSTNLDIRLAIKQDQWYAYELGVRGFEYSTSSFGCKVFNLRCENFAESNKLSGLVVIQSARIMQNATARLYTDHIS